MLKVLKKFDYINQQKEKVLSKMAQILSSSNNDLCHHAFQLREKIGKK